MRPLAIFLSLACWVAAQEPAAKAPYRMEITLERQVAERWTVVDPGFVFENGDRVRFRFRANFDGYLYVMNYGTTGKYSLLFPREETGRQNKTESDKEYRIPSTEAWFRIGGPPGHDVVYWLVSPLALEGGDAGFAPMPPPGKQQPPKILLPRCDDSIFRARGECIDSSAGLRGIPEAEALPENLKGVPRAKSRELVIMRKQDSSLVSSPVPLTGPVLYEFRLAHK
jgi:hypothetical protein